MTRANVVISLPSATLEQNGSTVATSALNRARAAAVAVIAVAFGTARDAVAQTTYDRILPSDLIAFAPGGTPGTVRVDGAMLAVNRSCMTLDMSAEVRISVNGALSSVSYVSSNQNPGDCGVSCSSPTCAVGECPPGKQCWTGNNHPIFGPCYCLVRIDWSAGDLALAAGDLVAVDLVAAAGSAPETFTPNDGASVVFGTSVIYCTAGISSNGCVPGISGTGTASASALSGFTLAVANMEGQKQGLFFYGITGAASAPWGVGGTSYLCVKSPVQRIGLQGTGGSNGQCDGAMAIDWLAHLAANPGLLGTPLSAGRTFNAQAWYRDPPAVKTTNLSDGLEFTLVP
jgi:hypothetical protein